MSSSSPPAERSSPRAVFLRPGLGLEAGGLTKAVLGRIRLLDAAGWSVHLGLTRDDPSIDATLEVLRADGRLPPNVAVHHLARDRIRRHRRRMVMPWLRSQHAVTIPSWLDGLASTEGAVVFADSPWSYSVVAAMRNPRVSRVFGVHLCHLSAAATRLGDPVSIANGPLTLRWADVSDATIRAADRIVVLTDSQRRDFQLRWGANLPVEVIPHYASPVACASQEGFDASRVAGLGQLRRGKGWDDSIQVMARVVARVPRARLVVHGVGDEFERLVAVTERLGMSASVTFAGYSTAPLAALASSACLLSTTRREAMPLALLESLSVGTPVVVYDVRYGPSEVVRDGVDGFVVPARDVAAAAGAVVRLLTEPDLREGMSRAATEVTSRFSREAHDRAWLELGREVHEQRGHHARAG